CQSQIRHTGGQKKFVVFSLKSCACEPAHTCLGKSSVQNQIRGCNKYCAQPREGEPCPQTIRFQFVQRCCSKVHRPLGTTAPMRVGLGGPSPVACVRAPQFPKRRSSPSSRAN